MNPTIDPQELDRIEAELDRQLAARPLRVKVLTWLADRIDDLARWISR